MSRKFFSLMRGHEVRLAPGARFIPSKELETLVNADAVLKLVQEEALEYRKKVAEEAELAREAAWKEGYEAGFQEWTQHVVALEATLAALRQDVQKRTLPMALLAAKKMVGRELELSDHAILDIVISVLRPVTQHKRIIIYVNPEDYIKLEQQKPKLKSLFEHLESLSVRPKEGMTRGGCIVETEVGIINAEVENRWVVLERAFEKMVGTLPAEPSTAEKDKSHDQSKESEAEETTEE